MSGTSMDGVDAALIDTDVETSLVPGRNGLFPYGEADRALLRLAIEEAASLEDRNARPGRLAPAEEMITLRHTEAAEAFLLAESLRAERI